MGDCLVKNPITGGCVVRAPDVVTHAVNSTRDTISRTWKDAGRGEIGKYVGGYGQSIYDIAMAPARAVKTGNYAKELGRVAGGVANVYTFGATNYLGQSSGVNRALNSDQVFGKNLAAGLRVSSNLSRGNDVSNADRNLAWQGVVKAGAVAAAAYGGYAAYSAYAGSGAAVDAAAIGAEDAALADSIPLSEEALGSAAGGATKGGFWSSVYGAGGSTLQTAGAVAIGSKILGGQGGKAVQDILNPGGGGGGGTDTGGFWDAVNNLIDGTKSQPKGSQYIVPMDGGSSGGASVSTPAAMSVSMIAVLAIGGIYFARKAKVI